MVAWVVIDRQQPRQARPFASLLSTPAITLPPLSPLSPFFSNTCALFCFSLHFFALTKSSTHFFSSDSALFAKNPWGGGGATNPVRTGHIPDRIDREHP